MGAPRRNRKKFERPSNIWNSIRIEEEHKLRDGYGLKNLHELWRATSEIRRIKRNVRDVLSGRVSDEVGRSLISRLSRYGIVKDEAILDDLLEIRPESILDRRLQSIVHRRGLAKTLRQSRQLIAHGFIAINGRKVHSPGYLVSKAEEPGITYYKPIRIEFGEQAAAVAPASEPAAEESSEGNANVAA